VRVYSGSLTNENPSIFEILQRVPYVLDFLHVFTQDGPAKHILQFPDEEFLKCMWDENKTKFSAIKTPTKLSRCVECGYMLCAEGVPPPEITVVLENNLLPRTRFPFQIGSDDSGAAAGRIQIQPKVVVRRGPSKHRQHFQFEGFLQCFGLG
jgi:hypothetical protein